MTSQPAHLPNGICIFLTGLSGAGKSTIANALDDAVRARWQRAVTVLDGDVVRAHLSSDLGFSKADRDRNIMRIAFVAREVVRHGGVAIAAAIAPWHEARAEARRMVGACGRFILVHVATPLEVCEARDPKGLYVRARRGEISAFTGISDPYEPPEDADLTIDTSAVSIERAVSLIIDAMTQPTSTP